MGHLTMICRILGWSLATFLLAGSAVVPPAGDGTLRFFDVTTAHGVFDGAPLQPNDVFTSEDTPIYVWFRCEGCTIGTVITSSWLYLEPDPPVQFARGSVVVETTDDFGEFHCELISGKRWPPGAYRIELRVNDVLQAQTRFSVVLNTD